jgi:hypothetical protein
VGSGDTQGEQVPRVFLGDPGQVQVSQLGVVDHRVPQLGDLVVT